MPRLRSCLKSFDDKYIRGGGIPDVGLRVTNEFPGYPGEYGGRISGLKLDPFGALKFGVEYDDGDYEEYGLETMQAIIARSSIDSRSSSDREKGERNDAPSGGASQEVGGPVAGPTRASGRRRTSDRCVVNKGAIGTDDDDGEEGGARRGCRSKREVEVLFDGTWYAGHVVREVPAGVRVEFACDQTWAAIDTHHVPTHIRPAPAPAASAGSDTIATHGLGDDSCSHRALPSTRAKRLCCNPVPPSSSSSLSSSLVPGSASTLGAAGRQGAPSAGLATAARAHDRAGGGSAEGDAKSRGSRPRNAADRDQPSRGGEKRSRVPSGAKAGKEPRTGRSGHRGYSADAVHRAKRARRRGPDEMVAKAEEEGNAEADVDTPAATALAGRCGFVPVSSPPALPGTSVLVGSTARVAGHSAPPPPPPPLPRVQPRRAATDATFPGLFARGGAMRANLYIAAAHAATPSAAAAAAAVKGGTAIRSRIDGRGGGAPFQNTPAAVAAGARAGKGGETAATGAAAAAAASPPKRSKRSRASGKGVPQGRAKGRVRRAQPAQTATKPRGDGGFGGGDGSEGGSGGGGGGSVSGSEAGAPAEDLDALDEVDGIPIVASSNAVGAAVPAASEPPLRIVHRLLMPWKERTPVGAEPPPQRKVLLSAQEHASSVVAAHCPRGGHPSVSALHPCEAPRAGGTVAGYRADFVTRAGGCGDPAPSSAAPGRLRQGQPPQAASAAAAASLPAAIADTAAAAAAEETSRGHTATDLLSSPRGAAPPLRQEPVPTSMSLPSDLPLSPALMQPPSPRSTGPQAVSVRQRHGAFGGTGRTETAQTGRWGLSMAPSPGI